MTDEPIISTAAVIDVLAAMTRPIIDDFAISDMLAHLVNGPGQAYQLANAITVATAALINNDLRKHAETCNLDHPTPLAIIRAAPGAPTNSPLYCATQMLTAAINGDADDVLSLARPAIFEGTEETGAALIIAELRVFRSVHQGIYGKSGQ